MVKTATWPVVKDNKFTSHRIQDDLIAFLKTTDAIDIFTGPENYFRLISKDDYVCGRTKEQRPYVMYGGFKIILKEETV